MKHYTNTLVENVDEHIADLAMIGVTAVMGDPIATGNNALAIGRPYTVAEIRAIGGRGIFVDDKGDPRTGIEIVNAAWEQWHIANPNG